MENFKVGDIVRIKKGRFRSNEQGISYIVKAKVTSTTVNPPSWFSDKARVTQFVKIKCIEGNFGSGYNMTSSGNVFADCLELFKTKVGEYEIF